MSDPKRTPFEYHAPESAEAADMVTVRAGARDLFRTIVQTVPPSAERTLALRSLQQVVFWSNTAIMRIGLD